MEQGRFFYSADGTDVQGPVAWDVLQQLYQNGILGPGSHLCREGETEWQPLNPDAFRLPVAQPPPTPPPFVPPVPFVQAHSDSTEGSGAAKWIVEGIGVAAAIGAAVLTAAWMHPKGDLNNAISFRLGGFAGALIFFALPPYLISLLFKRLTRSIVRGAGMLILAVLSIAGQSQHLAQARALDTADKLSSQTKEDARKEIAAKGYYSGDTQKAEQDLQQVKNQLSDDSEVSRLARDLLDVTHQLLAKVKTSDTAENACNFEVKGMATQDDIAARRALLEKLRDCQTDVKTFLENYDTHCHEAMAHENASPTSVDQIIGGARKGGHIDVLVTLWDEKIKLTDDYVARLDLLSQKFGAWSDKDGKILFQDDSTVADYNKVVANLHDDVTKLKATQQQFFK